MTTTRPATSGTCNVVGCDNGADFETQTSTDGLTFRVALSCVHHARPFELAAMVSSCR